MRSVFTEIDGIKVYYEESGSGDYAFIFPGWGCTAAVYRQMAEVLEKKYCVIVPDLPGFGQSQEPPFCWNTADYCGFCIKFINHFTSDHVVLIGHSNGVRILLSMALCQNLPYAIDKMVFFDGAGLFPRDYGRYLDALDAFENRKKQLEQEGNLEELQKVRANADSDYAYLSDLMIGVCRNVIADDYYEDLPKVKTPTLLIWGENDQDTPVAEGKIMQERMQDAGLVILKNAGHFSFLDKPIEVSRILKSFFELPY